MPVSRWSAELLELLEWANREDLSLDDIFLGSVISNLDDIDDNEENQPCGTDWTNSI